MAFFPKIQRPCPYRANLAAVMDGDYCTMCARTVFDLTPLDDEARRALLAGCVGGEICVSYRVPRAALTATMLAAAAAIPAAAAAQEPMPAVPYAAAIAAEQAANMEEVAIVVGGIRDAADTATVDSRAEAKLPPLPVVYEDAPAEATQTAAPAASVSG